ncbi:hypothetical protein L7F22_043698 [Adiantum nelumboides]|nr:hypothetical protein [Adiantum nelumboides]
MTLTGKKAIRAAFTVPVHQDLITQKIKMSIRLSSRMNKPYALVACNRSQITNHLTINIRQKTTSANERSKSNPQTVKAQPNPKPTPVKPTSSPPKSPKRSIAVVGAGLSGLTHALYLARGLSKEDGKYRIVVYDSADRVGGWVKSDRIKPKGIEDGEGALLESGPRSIRMADLGGLSTTELVATLDLGDEVISVPKTAESAYRRMIKYGGNFHVLPHDPWSFFQTVFKKSHVLGKSNLEDIGNVMDIVDRKSIRTKFPDESVESFLTRMLAPKNKDGTLKDENPPTPAVIEYLVSAVFHGIYAADVSQLSIRAVLPQVYHAGLTLHRDKTSWLPWPFNIRLTPLYTLGKQGEEWATTEYNKHRLRLAEKTAFSAALGQQITEMVAKSSVMSFKNGIQTLTDAIANECRQKGVEFRLNTKIESISVLEQSGKAVIRSNGGQKDTFNKVTSSLPSQALQGLLSDTKLPNLTANPSTTVCVVNFAIPAKYKIRLPPAFGYLVPRASDKEGDNPFGHLGTVFDSEAVPGQDSYTKLTMMFGGPYWKPGYAMYDLINATDLKESREELAIELASTLLDPHLQDAGQSRSIINNADVIKRIQVQKDCIPTYTVGHFERMDELHQALKKKENAPLSVLGASYTGVSLNDCILYARRTALRTVISELKDDLANMSGLEDYLSEP